MSWTPPLLLPLVLVFAGAVSARAGEARINDRGQIEVSGHDVRVFRGEAQAPLFGSVTREGHICRFSPALSFVAGESYRVEFQNATGGWQTERLRNEESRPAAAPAVALSPSPAVLPANALKLYLHFTQPMEQGVFLERITLHRQDESIVRGGFRETELWSPDGRRLTLWLHPGRQKTGVNLNRDEGPVLIAGETHVLKISGSWRSAAGVPLGKDTSFTLIATAVDHECPDPKRWKRSAPKAATREPVTLIFNEPLDPAMLRSALSVRSSEGTVQVSADARTWSWTPVNPWRPGSHTLAIDPLLEDLAGNTLEHPFEVDRDQGVPRKQARTTMTFDVR